MLSIILAVIGFLITTGTLGEKIVGSMELLGYLYWLIFGIGIIIVLAVVVMGSIGGWAMTSDATNNKLGIVLGTISGAGLSSLLGAFILLLTGARLWLTYFVIEHINTSATQLSDLGQDATVGLCALAVLTVIGIFSKTKKITIK